MRVISGSARGRKLKEPSGFDIRPTSAKVKESIFSIVQFDIEGRRVLDLFAGTGQLGIEALSRGARNAVFVDSNPEAAKIIRHNLKVCGFIDLASVQLRDTIRYLDGILRMFTDAGNVKGLNAGSRKVMLGKRNWAETFDLIFIDPPYGSSLLTETLSRIIAIDKLNTNGIIICETKADIPTPAVESPYFLYKEYKYGSTKIIRYDREG